MRKLRGVSRVKRAGILAGILVIGVSGIAVAEQVEAGKLIISVDGGFTPTTLPKKSYAPISLNANIDIGTKDGSVPPPLQKLVLDFDRNGLVQTKGLPVCQPSKLENTTPDAARKACASSIVGLGSSSAQIVFPDQGPIPVTSPITIFNGPRIGGNPSVIVHAYITVPAPTTFVIPAPIVRTGGRYRYEVTSNIPPIAGGYGSLTHVDFNVHKTWRSRGKRVSYASARCTDGRLQAQGQFTFADGTVASGSVFRPCRSRG